MAVFNPYNYKRPPGVQVSMSAEKPVNQVNMSNGIKSKSDVYLEQRIMNAKPEELTLMLYEGIMRFISQAKLSNDQNAIEKSNNANMRAQAIIEELRSTLDMNYEVSENLESLYVFMIERLVDANVTKDNAVLDEVLDLATELRDTWKQAMNL